MGSPYSASLADESVGGASDTFREHSRSSYYAASSEDGGMSGLQAVAECQAAADYSDAVGSLDAAKYSVGSGSLAAFDELAVSEYLAESGFSAMCDCLVVSDSQAARAYGVGRAGPFFASSGYSGASDVSAPDSGYSSSDGTNGGVVAFSEAVRIWTYAASFDARGGASSESSRA